MNIKEQIKQKEAELEALKARASIKPGYIAKGVMLGAYYKVIREVTKEDRKNYFMLGLSGSGELLVVINKPRGIRVDTLPHHFFDDLEPATEQEWKEATAKTMKTLKELI